mgnify:CR=1 FL=1
MIVSEALQAAFTRLSTSSESPQLDAELLLAECVKKNRSWLRGFSDETLTAEQLERFEILLALREAGQPIAHILGLREFWSLPLKVTADTLIPRPDTERLVELALEKIPADKSTAIADLGTGSGAIALAIASECPSASVVASDASDAALAVARENGARLNITNIEWRSGSWCEALPTSKTFDVITSNPPYIDENDEHLSQGDVRFEPLSALVASDSGLADLKVIIQQSRNHLKPNGWLLLEHGWQQGAAVTELLNAAGYQHVHCDQDYAGNDRVSSGQYVPSP